MTTTEHETTSSALRLTHSHHQGTLLAGTERGDGTGAIAKAHRLRWSRALGAGRRGPRPREPDGGDALSGTVGGARIGLVTFPARAIIDLDAIRDNTAALAGHAGSAAVHHAGGR